VGVRRVLRVLILLPPSEGKAEPPARGRPLDLDALSFGELGPTRARILDVLVELCRTDPERAAEVLELGPKLAGEVAVDAALVGAPTLPAHQLYTGVLYAALGLNDLPTAALRRAGSRLAIASGLWGLVRPADRLPRYRLPGGISLPGLGTLSSVWKPVLGDVVPGAVGTGALLDLRSTTYAAAWSPAPDLARRTVTVRVLHERDGVRRVVSEANKAVKGRLTRAVLLDGSAPRTAAALAELVGDLGERGGAAGWRTEESTEPAARRRSGPIRLDLIAGDLRTAARLDGPG
jgi:cytoplasmic iron level regulating protein YaaA (DUF328/UPF0246 family)